MITKNINRKHIKETIREYFFENPTTKLRVRHIERALKLPLPSVIRYVKDLEKERILKKTEISGVVFYSADRSSKEFLLEKKQHNINRLIDSGITDFLIKKSHNSTIIVFGSFSRGEDVENSDIDIYIETPAKETFELKEFEKKLNRKIQIFNYKNIKEVGNKELANNIINGSILNSFLEVM